MLTSVSYCILFVFSIKVMLFCISWSWTEVIMWTMKLWETMMSLKQYYDFTRKLLEIRTELFPQPLLLQIARTQWVCMMNENATNIFNRETVFLMPLTYSRSSWQMALVKSSCSFYQPKKSIVYAVFLIDSRDMSFISIGLLYLHVLFSSWVLC